MKNCHLSTGLTQEQRPHYQKELLALPDEKPPNYQHYQEDSVVDSKTIYTIGGVDDVLAFANKIL